MREARAEDLVIYSSEIFWFSSDKTRPSFVCPFMLADVKYHTYSLGVQDICTLCRRGSRGGEMGEFSPPPRPFFRAPFFLSFFLSLKHLNQALVLLPYYKNSPPISKSWIRACCVKLDIEHLCYSQLTAVKKGYTPTRFT